jgi:5-amino-6-(5-phosphoribosylamino)uracil reductase
MRIIACFAATLDGKIASAHNLRDRIGTEADLQHLLTVRNQADAIICGGETFRQHANIRKGNQQSQAPLQCIITRTINLPPEASLFRNSVKTDPPVPIVIFSPEPASAATQAQYPSHIEWVTTGPGNPVPVILEALRQKGIQTLMMEGGGHIMNLFLQAQAIHELHLTVCPLLLGGQNDPTLVTGPGFTVANAPRTTVRSSNWVGQELYLHLDVHYPPSSGH